VNIDEIASAPQAAICQEIHRRVPPASLLINDL
jgi:hypothetical protein